MKRFSRTKLWFHGLSWLQAWGAYQNTFVKESQRKLLLWHLLSTALVVLSQFTEPISIWVHRMQSPPHLWQPNFRHCSAKLNQPLSLTWNPSTTKKKKISCWALDFRNSKHFNTYIVFFVLVLFLTFFTGRSRFLVAK